MVFGLLEAGIFAVQYFGFGHIINRHIYFVWMAPASLLLINVSVTLPLLLVSLLWPKVRRVEVAVFVYAIVGTLSLLIALFAGRVHWWAVGLLTAGVAVQLARSTAKRRVAFLRLTTMSAPWLVALVMTVGISLHAFRTLSERRGIAALTDDTHELPDVLVIILDTVRRSNLSLHGYDRPTTPNLRQFATKGVTFERAITPSSWTLPAHASMFTGRMPSELSADWMVPLDDKYPTLAETLTAEGYATAGFVANRDYGTYLHGLHRGFIHYEDFRISLGEIFLSSGLGHWLGRERKLRPLFSTDYRLGFKKAEHVVDDFLAWRKRQAGRPTFAFLNLYDAHDPYLPPDPWYRMFGLERDNRLSEYTRGDITRLTAEQIASELSAYDGAIAYMDDQVGRLLDELSHLGVLDSTIVIITSDHGEEFGEHDLILHGHSLFANQLRVPLVVSYPPTVPAGVSVPHAVSLRDIAATVLDLSGVVAAPTFQGTSLSIQWHDSVPEPNKIVWVISELRKIENAPSHYPAAHGDMLSMVRGDEHHIQHTSGRVLFYDWATDPGELNPQSMIPGR
jgi:arylsulfatase A-like enzyme